VLSSLAISKNSLRNFSEKEKKLELFDLIKICYWDNIQELIIGDFYLFVSLENKVLVIFLFSHYKVV
jgi:hypothetical protein